MNFDNIFWPEWMPFGHTWSPEVHIAAVFIAIAVLLLLVAGPLVTSSDRRKRRRAAVAAKNRTIDLSDEDAAAASALGRAMALDEFREDRMGLILQVWGDHPNVDDMEEVIFRTADNLRQEWADREWSVPRTEKFCDRYEYPLSTLLDDYRLRSLLLSAGLSGTAPDGKRAYPALVEVSETGGGMCAVFSACPSVTLESWIAAIPHLTSALDSPKATVRAGDDGEVVVSLNDRADKPTNGPPRREINHAPRRQLENRIPETRRSVSTAPIPVPEPGTDDAHTVNIPIDVEVISEYAASSPFRNIAPAALPSAGQGAMTKDRPQRSRRGEIG